MKKLVVIIVSVLTVNTINAQYNDIASIDVSNDIELTKPRVETNTISKEELSYSESINNFEEALIIKNLETTIISYNLEEDAIYDNSERATYSVVFNKKNAKAIVIYDTNGVIVNVKEKYRNVRLPYQFAASITKDYSGFYVKNTNVIKTYKKSFGTETIYKVVISNGSKTKTLEFEK